MRRLLALLLFFIPTITFGQLGVDYYLSNIPFFGMSYEISDRIRPEVRIGTDTFLSDLSFEATVTYDIINTENYEFYAGIGARSNRFSGAVIPVGFKFYPLEDKNFGFLMELSPILGETEILRGSVGLRYKFARFKK